MIYVIDTSYLRIKLILKGLAMIFAGQENPLIIFRKTSIFQWFQKLVR